MACLILCVRRKNGGPFPVTLVEPARGEIHPSGFGVDFVWHSSKHTDRARFFLGEFRDVFFRRGRAGGVLETPNKSLLGNLAGAWLLAEFFDDLKADHVSELVGGSSRGARAEALATLKDLAFTCRSIHEGCFVWRDHCKLTHHAT